MPSITINEIDNTKGGGSAVSREVVYIPGFATKGPVGVPTLCKNVGEFEDIFGEGPFKFTEAEKYPAEFPAVYTDKEIVSAMSFDKSYLMAKQLLSLGLYVLYECVGDADNKAVTTVDGFYRALVGPETEIKETIDDEEVTKIVYNDTVFNKLLDKGEYSFKYLTSGGYPTLEYSENFLAINMGDVAYNRGDCIALIDHIDDPDRAFTGDTSVYDVAKEFSKTLIDASYSALYTPWANVILSATEQKKEISMPGSYCYLAALAKSLKTNAAWIAIAGAARGQVPGLSDLNTTRVLTNSIANDKYQSRSDVAINPITNIKPFGYRIWGNRTLKDSSVEQNVVATSFVNIRNLVSDVKKVVWDACRRFTFEQNNDVLWVNFKAAIEPTLDQMKTGAGISGYKIIKQTTNEKAKLAAVIKLYPIFAVEDFEITVTMEDEEISVS